MQSAYEWKRFYAAERDRLGVDGLRALLERARPLEIDLSAGALVIPHTRLSVTGSQIADAVATVLDSGAERVLALGVLHGARRVDREQVAAARSGDPEARAALRGVHDPTGLAAEEFSLDAFVELLALAADVSGRTVEVMERYPFLIGDDPASLPGLDALAAELDAGAVLVATTDPIHHGHAYGTEPTACRPAEAASTVSAARLAIDEQLEALSDGRYGDFATLTDAHRSDFRDTGPTMTALLGPGFRSTVHALSLVDYSDVLHAPSPSWVAGALVTVDAA